mmetsp:Transcript_19041/g.26578  ORF Transcript_19041/g.26578 Transcript_19041/m.26578 type:complete len:107 (-) Transcript_19041:1190-1510(-)
MPNQRTRRATKVPNGTAPELFSPQTIAFKIKKITNDTPGKAKLVAKLNLLQFSTPKILPKNVPANPANIPIRTKSRSILVMRPPLFAGDKKPSTAKKRVTTDIPIS